jgi:hypothetical protein
MEYQLAQINIARMLAPLDDPIMAEFVARLPEINALAEAAPGFVWRLTTPEGDATSIRAFDDDYIIVNMSVWDSVESLYQYTYYSQHVEVYRKRQDWFSKLADHSFALWWIPAGHIPTPEEGRDKLAYLWLNGPSPLAFTFKQQFTVADLLEFQAAHP